MKILIISLAFAPYSGVGAARMTSLVDYLIKKHHEVIVVDYAEGAFKGLYEREIPTGCIIESIKRVTKEAVNINNLSNTINNILTQKSIDIVVCSVGPFESLKALSGIYKKKIPYILDYRDLWLFYDSAAVTKTIKEKIGRLKKYIYDLLSLQCEYKILKRASSVVFVSDGCKNVYKKRYRLSEEKIKVIYNGFENQKLYKQQKKTNMLKIGIAGKFFEYNETAAKQFLDVCNYMNKQFCILINKIGKKDNVDEKYNCIYNYCGEKDYTSTMEIMSTCDALLITYHAKNGLGTKIFDYISLKKPIIYIGDIPTELSEFVEKIPGGFVCKNSEDIKNVLNKVYEGYEVKNANIDEYSRESQNLKYEQLLLEIARY